MAGFDHGLSGTFPHTTNGNNGHTLIPQLRCTGTSLLPFFIFGFWRPANMQTVACLVVASWWGLVPAGWLLSLSFNEEALGDPSFPLWGILELLYFD